MGYCWIMRKTHRFISILISINENGAGKVPEEPSSRQVFNWLNRKMHSNTEYRTIHGNKAMAEDDSVLEIVAEKDTEALLLRDVLLNGILAIGTLGHDVDLCPEACIEEDVLLIMGEQKVGEEKYEEGRNDKVQEDVLVTAPTELAPVVQPAKLHSSSMKEDSFVCFVEEEIQMLEVEEGITNIQQQPLLMVEKVEKIRTTLADLFAAEVFSASSPVEEICHHVTTVPGASTSKPMSCMEKMHQKNPTKATPKSLKATRKLSRVRLLTPMSCFAIILILEKHWYKYLFSNFQLNLEYSKFIQHKKPI